MQIVWTSQDRRSFERVAWQYVKHLNAPRHVRMLLRDQLVKDLMVRAVADLTITPDTKGTVTK